MTITTKNHILTNIQAYTLLIRQLSKSYSKIQTELKILNTLTHITK